MLDGDKLILIESMVDSVCDGCVDDKEINWLPLLASVVILNPIEHRIVESLTSSGGPDLSGGRLA